MIEISNFTIKSIIEFINSLRLIIIPNTSLSLLGFYISLIALSLIMTFLRRFFRIEQNILNTKINASYFNRRQNLIYTASNNYNNLNNKLLDTRTNLRSKLKRK